MAVGTNRWKLGLFVLVGFGLAVTALVVFGDGDVVEASASGAGGRFLLAAAKPLREPIARYGPFVMNTRAEIEETLRELRSGRFIREEARD